MKKLLFGAAYYDEYMPYDRLDKDIEMMKKAGIKGLIIDLRGNGGGILQEAVKILSMFVPKGTEVVSMRGRMKELDATFVTQRVWFGDSNEAKLGAGEAGSITLPKGQLKNLKASYTLNQPQLTAPLEKGQVVGTIDFKLNDKTIEQRPLIVMESVKEGGFFSRMIDFVLMKLHGWFGSWFS